MKVARAGGQYYRHQRNLQVVDDNGIFELFMAWRGNQWDIKDWKWRQSGRARESGNLIDTMPFVDI